MKLLYRLLSSSCSAQHDCIIVMHARILGFQSHCIVKMDQGFLLPSAAGQGERQIMMSTAERGIELQRILKSVDSFLKFPCDYEGFPQVIPDDCAGLALQCGLVMGDGFIVATLFRECETEIGLGYSIIYRDVRGVLEKSDAIMPVSQLHTRKPGAERQYSGRAESLHESRNTQQVQGFPSAPCKNDK